MTTSLTCTSRRVLILAVMPAVLLCPAARAQQFSITDLGSLGGPVAGGFGISPNQIVVGFSALSTADFHGFFWDGAMHDLAPLAGDTQSHALAINPLGQIAGVSYVLGGLTGHATLWQGGTATYLGDFLPRGINPAGTVVGYASSALQGRGWVDRACVYRDGALTTLTGLGGTFSYAYDVNTSEQIVGMSYTAAENAQHACVWQNNQPLDLGTLGGANSQAYAINSSGQVVGVADTAAGAPHAFLYALGSGQVLSKTDLGVLSGGYSYAFGLSGRGEVVGTSDSRAVYWNGASPVDLNGRIPAGSGWMLNSAMAINDNGQIVGIGTYQGWPRAFLLAPVAPDFDHDGDVDQDDFAHLQACYTKPGTPQTDPSCRDALLDGDSSVDKNDLAIFRKCFSGPGVPATPDCWR